MTIQQVAEETGLSKKAIARRIERGTLPAVVQSGVRRVPRSAVEDLPRGNHETDPMGQGEPRGTTDISPLIARLEALAAENASLRLLTQQAESQQQTEQSRIFELEAELTTTRARLTELEKPRRWFRRRQSGETS